MLKFKTIKRLWSIHKAKPYISMARAGQLTKTPRVSVSLHSKNGMQTLYSFDDNDQDNARAEIAAKTAAHIAGFPILDERAPLTAR